MGIAIAVRSQSPFRIEPYDTSEAIVQTCYSIWFYIQKTALPLDLAAVYPLPKELSWRSASYGLSVIATVATTTWLFVLWRRWPGVLAAWLSYLVVLLPNSGIIRNNSFAIAADRYSYMAMLGPVILMAGCFWRLARMSSSNHLGAAVGLATIGLGSILGLTALTRNQCRTWLNSETLWSHAVTHGANSSDLGHYNLGVVLESQRDFRAARDQYAYALRINPDHVDAHNNLGIVLERLGKHEAAVAHFTTALLLDPGHAGARINLGAVLSRHGKYEQAVAQYTELLQLQPGNADAHFNLATILSRQRKYPEAEAHFTECFRLNPGDADAHHNLGVVLEKQGKHEAAAARFAEAARLNRYDAKTHDRGGPTPGSSKPGHAPGIDGD